MFNRNLNFYSVHGWLLPFVLVFTSLAAILGLAGLKIASQTSLAVEHVQAGYRLSYAADQLIASVLDEVVSKTSCYNWDAAVLSPPHQLLNQCYGGSSPAADIKRLKSDFLVQVNSEYCNARSLVGFEEGSLMEFEFVTRARVTRKIKRSVSVEHYQFWTRVGESVELALRRTCV